MAVIERQKNLDGLRGLAVLLVVFYHLNLLGMGWVGVQLFFVLSGFFISQQLLGLRAQAPWGHGLKTFFGRRALRILPLYYAYLALVWAAQAWLPANQQVAFHSQWAYAASFTSNWVGMGIGHQKTYFLDHLWSLAIEEQFYLVWPFLMLCVPLRWLPRFLLALVLAGPLLRLGVSLWWPGTPWGSASTLPHAIAICTFSQLDAFAIGALLCFAKARHLRVVMRPERWLLGSLLLLWGAGALVNGAGWLPQQLHGAYFTLGYPNTLPLSQQWFWGFSAINAVCALLALLVMHKALARSLLEQGWLVRTGQLSYAIYVLHFPLAHLTSAAIYRLHDWTGLGLYGSLLLYTPLYLSVLYMLASLVHTLIEKPAWRLKHRWFPIEQDTPRK